MQNQAFYVLLLVTGCVAKTSTFCQWGAGDEYLANGVSYTIGAGDTWKSIAAIEDNADWGSTADSLQFMNGRFGDTFVTAEVFPTKYGSSDIKIMDYYSFVRTKPTCASPLLLVITSAKYLSAPEYCGTVRGTLQPGDKKVNEEPCLEDSQIPIDLLSAVINCQNTTDHECIVNFPPVDDLTLTDFCTGRTAAIEMEWSCEKEITQAPTPDYTSIDGTNFLSTIDGHGCSHYRDADHSCLEVMETNSFAKEACDSCCECRDHPECQRKFSKVNMNQHVVSPYEDFDMNWGARDPVCVVSTYEQCPKDCEGNADCMAYLWWNDLKECCLLKTDEIIFGDGVTTVNEFWILTGDLPACTFQPTTSQPTGVPSTGVPTGQPTGQPTGTPTGQPTGTPSGQPTTSTPTTSNPTTGQPTGTPTGQPTGQPTSLTPTGTPSTGHPSIPQSLSPTVKTDTPTSQPTDTPSSQPTEGSGSPTFYCPPITYTGFNFDQCQGDIERTFTVTLAKDEITPLGEIPRGIEGLSVTLETNDAADCDVQLYDLCGSGEEFEENSAIVAWCRAPCNKGLLSGAVPETATFKDLEIEYSGFNGIGGDKGKESIAIPSTTSRPMAMKGYGYAPGTATVTYSWTETHSQCCKGKEPCVGRFNQPMEKDVVADAGTIPAGLKEIKIYLTSDTDLDLQLSFGVTKIVGWCSPENPDCTEDGVLATSTKSEVTQTLVGGDVKFEYSGYNGNQTLGTKGHEWIKVSASDYTLPEMTLKVYAYDAGVAHVVYDYMMASL